MCLLRALCSRKTAFRNPLSGTTLRTFVFSLVGLTKRKKKKKLIVIIIQMWRVLLREQFINQRRYPRISRVSNEWIIGHRMREIRRYDETNL